MEAWEHIAPELPPGAKRRDGYIWCCQGEFRRPGDAWDWFTTQTGITRKAYAELIAPGLVRKAATRHIEEQTVVLMAMDVFGRFEFEVTDGGFCSFAQGKGSDICTAALATIRALGGGE